jgi:hypothetical protein
VLARLPKMVGGLAASNTALAVVSLPAWLTVNRSRLVVLDAMMFL